jgi:VWFA-related protein
MFLNAGRCSLFLVALLIAAAASAQQNSAPAQPGNGKIYLDVVVAPKSGPHVTGLQQQDFTLLDNKVPRPITSFAEVTGRQAPIEVILVIDAVNASHQIVDNARLQIGQFLRAESGQLAHPMAIAAFTYEGVKIVGNFSRDGNALGAALDREDTGLRTVVGGAGATEHWQLSLQALRELISSVAPHKERKIMIWVSPGWPLLSGLSTELTSKQEDQIFASIVNLSAQIQQARVTLYAIDPVGAGENVARISNYKEFIKGVSKPGQADVGDLDLPVLAIQSGGLALNLSNDIAGQVQQCIADSEPYYEISFDPAAADRPSEYHHLEIEIGKPGLIARTRQGYYAQPSPRH